MKRNRPHGPRCAATLLLILAFCAAPLAAQAQRPDAENPAGPEGTVPPGWQVRLDRPDPAAVVGADPDSSDIWFVTMTPGWHVTTGPAAVFYHPESTAEGTYRAETTIHLFDPGQRREAFGLILGGQNLDGADLSYDYFLIRQGGEFLLKRRTGDDTEVIQGWTKHDAVASFEPDGEASVQNTLAVEVGGAAVDFFVNGEQVASRPRAEINTEGVVGLRINHGLNVHISGFTVEQNEE